MKKIKVAINGAGRIGRAFYKISRDRDDVEVVVINDLGDIDNIAYLLKYDSAYQQKFQSVKASDDKKSIEIDGQSVAYLSEKDVTKLPWGVMGIDVVVEATGHYTSFEKARVHLTAGAKKVVITAPAKDDAVAEDEATVLMGINEDKLQTCNVTSNASCTTNAGSPLIQILNETRYKKCNKRYLQPKNICR